MAQSARAAVPAFVQAKATKTSSGTTNNATFSQANGAGNLIVVHVLWGNAGAVTLSDTKGNAYAAVAPATRFDGSRYSSQVFYAKNIAAAPANGNTVTATFGTAINNWAMVYAHEYSGMDKVTPVDVFGATTGTGTNLTGSLTTHQNNSLIFAAAVASDSAINSADASYSVHSKLSQDWTMSKVQSGVGTVNASASRAGSGLWVLQMVAFRPDGTPPPNQPPVVSITQPAGGAVVHGATWVRATATDPDSPVSRVEFYAGSQLLYSDLAAPYEFQLDSTTLADTTHILTAKAYDASVSSTSAPVQIVVDNAAPTVPTNLQAINVTSAQATLSWSASSDNRAVTGYVVFRDGNQVTTTNNTTYQIVGLSPNASYSFTVSAYDEVGNSSLQSTPLLVTTQPDMPPQVDLTDPINNTTVRATIPVSVTATDDVSIDRVEFSVDGILRDIDNVAEGDTFSIALDTTTLANIAHEIRTTAFDSLGQSTAATVTVVVDNLPPDAPGDLLAQAETSSQINLTWTASIGDVAYYKVFRGSTEIVSNLTATSYTDTGLAPASTYTYTVRAYDSVGNESPASTATATTPSSPDTIPPIISNGQPTAVQPAGTTSVVMSVETDEAATCKYATLAGQVYSAMPNSFTTTGSTTHSVTIGGLIDGQTNNFFVRCQDLAGNSNTTDYTISFSIAITPPVGEVAFPLRASSDGRYLEDQNGAPFLIMGDSPQGIIASLTLNEVDTYLANRDSYGFNTLWINLLSREQTGGPQLGQTPDNIYPFNTYLTTGTDKHHYDISVPNDAYFTRASQIIDKALDHGMLVILDPMETMDHLQLLRNNGLAKARDYGRYLGSKFTQPNIIWKHGNDFQTWGDLNDRTLVRTVGEGIRELDGTDTMQTVLGYASPSAALDFVYGKSGSGENSGPADPAWAPFVNISTIYTYGPSYDYVAPEFARAASYTSSSYSRGRIPVYLAETYYDFEEMVPGRSNRPLKEFRWQQYWAMLSGAAGHTYGNYDSVYLDGNWGPKLDTPAAANFQRWSQFFKSYPWYNLLPDQSLITAGADGGDWNRATASVTQDGSLGMVYIPNARTITINMARFNRQVTARWFNPVTGAYIALGTFGNFGTQQFTPIGLGNHTETDWYGNTETSNDWVLVLQTGDSDTQAPSVPTNLTASAVSSSQINLSWTASTDNAGVTGYKVYRDGVLISGNVTGTTFDDTGLNANTAYTYTVSAFDLAGNSSAQSASVSATTQSPPPPDTTPPTAPTNLAAGTTTTSQVPLSWTPSTDTSPGTVAGYHVLRCQGALCTNFAQVTTNLATSTSFTDTGLSSNTTYLYKVKAYDAAGNASTDSNILSVTTQTSPPLSSYLMAGWGFNEGIGSTTADTSANSNTATITGATWAAGKYGNGLNFGGGTGSRLSVANSPSLNIAGAELTLSLWLNPLTSGGGDTVVLGKFWNTSWSDPYYQYGLELSGGNRPTFIIGTTTGYKAASMSSTLTYGQWSHLGVTFNGSEVRFYLNGVLVNTQSLTGSITARSNPLSIGADQSNGQGFKGILDDVRIYRKILDQTDIQLDMNTSL